MFMWIHIFVCDLYPDCFDILNTDVCDATLVGGMVVYVAGVAALVLVK